MRVARPGLFSNAPVFFLIFVSLFISNCASDNKSSFSKAAIQKAEIVIHDGDLVNLQYSVSLTDGSLIYTNVEKIGSNPDYSWVRGYHRPETCYPETIIAGRKAPFHELEKLVTGMSPGESKKVALQSVDAFGERDSRLVVEFPAVRKVPRFPEESIAKIVKHSHQFPKPGFTFDYGQYFWATVDEVLEDTVRLKLKPKNTTINEPFGTVRIIEEGDEFLLKLKAETGKIFHWQDKKGVIKGADENSFIVDFNHPLAGREIQYDIKVISVVKASEAEQITIDWTDSYENGLKKAEKSHKPAVLVLYSSGCGPCKRYIAGTLKDPRIRMLNDRFVWIKVEATAKKELAKKYRLRTYPLTVFLTPDGEVISRIRGCSDAQTLRRELDKCLRKDERFGISTTLGAEIHATLVE